MGALAPIITTALLTQGTQLVLNEVVGNSSRDANDQALEQLKQRQALDERQRAQDAEFQRQSIALDAQEAEESRREALRRAVSRQRANFGAQGVGSGSGSSQAVLLGLFEESGDEKRRREELDNLRLNAIDQDLAQNRSINVLQRTQLAERNRLNNISSGRQIAGDIVQGASDTFF